MSLIAGTYFQTFIKSHIWIPEAFMSFWWQVWLTGSSLHPTNLSCKLNLNKTLGLKFLLIIGFLKNFQSILIIFFRILQRAQPIKFEFNLSLGAHLFSETNIYSSQTLNFKFRSSMMSKNLKNNIICHKKS